MRHRVRWLGLTLIAAFAFGSAGVWQYQRGIAKEAFLSDFAEAMAAKPLTIDEALRTPADLPRPVEGNLRRRPSSPWLLLDNARYDSQIGVRAIFPYLASNDTVLLIDFGWIQLPPDRSLPILDQPPEQLTGRGLLVGLPSAGYRMGENRWPTGEPARVLLTYLDIEELTNTFGGVPYSGMLRLDPAIKVGFARDLEALPNTLSADQHFGYALQWFGFATTSVLIYLIFLFRKSRP